LNFFLFYIELVPAVEITSSGVVSGLNASVILPNINENIGKAAPLAKAANRPKAINALSVGDANYNNFEKGTISYSPFYSISLSLLD